MTDNQPGQRPRPPMNWPTAVALVVLALAVVAVAWICGGVASDIWGGR